MVRYAATPLSDEQRLEIYGSIPCSPSPALDQVDYARSTSDSFSEYEELTGESEADSEEELELEQVQGKLKYEPKDEPVEDSEDGRFEDSREIALKDVQLKDPYQFSGTSRADRDNEEDQADRQLSFKERKALWEQRCREEAEDHLPLRKPVEPSVAYGPAGIEIFPTKPIPDVPCTTSGNRSVLPTSESKEELVKKLDALEQVFGRSGSFRPDETEWNVLFYWRVLDFIGALPDIYEQSFEKVSKADPDFIRQWKKGGYQCDCMRTFEEECRAEILSVMIAKLKELEG
ncbi:hypothetical protein BJ508DRAFT_380598 [Ascobolus immersus RN42]|uniref:Uncharacterized protein n=1 Tax=Ascobolus immersus RN42 TaxID=1160509 RepID=A0A3N4HXH2_ASCIM|nr:hypothetical protein BJ508DRAFT_380598 [Ascobolus immersus RN42]